MKNTTLLLLLTLLSTLSYSQQPTVANAQKEVEQKRYKHAVAKKFNFDVGKIKVKTGELIFQKTMASLNNNWGNDEAVVNFTYTTPKDGEGVWYEQTAMVIYIKSKCVTEGGSKRCFQLNNWELKASYYSSEYKTLGAKEISDNEFVEVVEQYLDKNREEMMKVSEHFENVIQFNDVSIWSGKGEFTSPTEISLKINIDMQVGTFSPSGGEMTDLRTLTIMPNITFIKEKNGWKISSIGGARHSWNSGEPDGKLYDTYKNSGFYSLKNKKIEREIPINSCSAMTKYINDYYNEYVKVVGGEKNDLTKYFEDTKVIDKEVKMIASLLASGYQLKITDLSAECTEEVITEEKCDGCRGYYTVHISHPNAKSKMAKELSKHSLIKKPEAIMAKYSAPSFTIMVNPYLKNNQWHLKSN